MVVYPALFQLWEDDLKRQDISYTHLQEPDSKSISYKFTNPTKIQKVKFRPGQGQPQRWKIEASSKPDCSSWKVVAGGNSSKGPCPDEITVITIPTENAGMFFCYRIRYSGGKEPGNIQIYSGKLSVYNGSQWRDIKTILLPYLPQVYSIPAKYVFSRSKATVWEGAPIPRSVCHLVCWSVMLLPCLIFSAFLERLMTIYPALFHSNQQIGHILY